LLAALIATVLAANKPAAAAENPVKAWGDNGQGQLGNGTAGASNSSNAPVGVSNLSSASRVAGGCLHSLALKKGKVYAWGNNEKGQLGAQTPNFYSATPVKVQTASGGTFGGVTRISAGCIHNLALKKNGTVWAWGDNVSGQLGNGTKGVGTPDSRPAKVENLSNVKAVSAGGSFSLALKKDGTVWAWGNNESGQLGDGTSDAYSLTPVQVKGPGGNDFLTNVKAIYASSYHALAVKEDGTVYAWGANDQGQLGDGTIGGESNTPVQVKVRWGLNLVPLTDVKAVAGGLFHSLALREDGTVSAWGSNASGQLGHEGNNDSPTAVQVKQPNLGGSTPLTGVKAISAGMFHSLALKKDGTVRAWGANDQGQLGDGTNNYHNLAVPVQTDGGDALKGIKAIDAGRLHSLAVKR